MNAIKDKNMLYSE
jgi:hypothetical protein